MKAAIAVGLAALFLAAGAHAQSSVAPYARRDGSFVQPQGTARTNTSTAPATNSLAVPQGRPGQAARPAYGEIYTPYNSPRR